MNNLNTEIFANHDKTIAFTFWENEDNGDLMVSYDNHTGINSTDARRVNLEELKHIFNICMDERPCYSLCDVDETEFYIKIVSPGEFRYIIFNEYDNKDITVQFLTRGLYIDKSDPHNWVEREDVMELGNEHQLTCNDLYRIRKMCNISDIELRSIQCQMF